MSDYPDPSQDQPFVDLDGTIRPGGYYNPRSPNYFGNRVSPPSVAPNINQNAAQAASKDLPPISQNLDDPLPQVDPNSALVPYRLARTDPGQAPVVTTGYGPRARPPVQPPEGFGGGAGMPNLDQIYQAAFSKLPVEQAVKAVEAATRYVAQRSYQRDLQSGADPIQTFAKYAPLMFRQATGVPEAFQAQMQRARMNAPTIHPAGGGLYRVPATGPAETLVPPKAAPTRYEKVGSDLYEIAPGKAPVRVASAPESPETVTESYKIPAVEGQEAQPESKGFLGFGAHPAVPAVEGQPEKTVKTTRKISAKGEKTLTKELATQFLKQAKGDKEKARKLARDAGYQF